MSFFIDVFNSILYQPLFNALIWLYQFLPVHDFGLAVIVLTVLIRFLLYPVMIQSIKSQKQMQEIQPRLQEIREKYKHDKEKQSRAMMEFYQKEKINPFSGCFSMLIQFPILIALFLVFKAFQGGLDLTELGTLYSFVPSPGNIAEPMFFGLINLATPNLVLAFLAGLTQFFQTKMLTPKTKKSPAKDQMGQFSQMMQKQMLYLFPAFMVLILIRLPAAIGLYWIITALFSIGQQALIFKHGAVQPKQN